MRGAKHSARDLFPALAVVGITAFMFLLDPYSYGTIGTDFLGDVRHEWQSVAAAGSIGLLVLATILTAVRQIAAAIVVTVFDLALLLTTNVIYVLRDGFEIRAQAGYEGSPLPIIALLIGFMLRVCFTLYLWRMAERMRG